MKTQAQDDASPWHRIDELFHEACELPDSEVQAFCERESHGDEELCQFLYDLVMAAEIGDEDIRASVEGLAQEVASDANLTDERVGAYRIGDLLGRGGMGEVYLANRADGEYEKTVAIKVVRSRSTTDDFLRHFRTERQVLASLQHPNVPRLIDAGQLPDGRPYFITEYVDGTSIDRYCDAQGLSTRQRLNLIQALCNAVQHAHSMLALHLDIKPANVLVDSEGVVKLLDFGIARLTGDPDSGHKAFTPSYASPEQIRGDTPTAASDVFSLGVLMFFLLTGEEPFEAPRFAPRETRLAEHETLTERVEKTAAAARLDPELRSIVLKAISPSRQERYATVAALVSDLKRYRRHLPLQSMPPSFAYQARKLVQRRWLGLALGAVIVSLSSLYIVREIQLRKEAQLAYASAEQEATAARQVSTFLTSLFRVADPGEDRASSLTARELLDRGAERISRDLEDQPAVAGRLMDTMGDVYVLLGMHEKSMGLYEEAVELLDAGGAGMSVEQGLALSGLGDAYTRLGRFDDARRVLERSLGIFRDGQESIERASVIRTLGTLDMREGLAADAESRLLEAKLISDRVLAADDPERAEYLAALARVYFASGRNEAAEPLYLEAIDIQQQAYGSDYPHLAILLENIGNLYNQMQRYDDAATYLKRGLALREATLSGDHPMVSYSLMNLSALLVNTNQLDEAEPYLLQAIDIQQRIFDPDDYRLGLSRYNLAELHYKRGELDPATRLANQALGAFERQLDARHRFIGHVTLLLGQIHATGGDEEVADAMFARSYDVFQDRPADDPVRRDLVEKYADYLQSTGRGEQAATLREELDG